MILVLSGTRDGREIAREIKASGREVLATAVTAFGSRLLQEGEIAVREGCLDEAGLAKLLQERKIRTVVDATHPYAAAVSRMAIAVCERVRVRYIRYERPESLDKLDQAAVITVPSFEEAARVALACKGQVFLAVGSRQLEVFCRLIPRERIVARVLPHSDSLLACERLELQPANIIALQGPFSRELNSAMLSHARAGVLVTKDSGSVGGTEEKIMAALELGLPVIVVGRPRVEYPLVTKDREQLLALLDSEERR